MITHRARSAFRKEVKMRNKTRDLIGLTLVCTFIINGQKLQGRGDTIEEAIADAEATKAVYLRYLEENEKEQCSKS